MSQQVTTLSGRCYPISSCLALNRIIKYLNEYEETELVDIGNKFNKNTTPFLTNDFNHILINHLGDKITTNQATKQFEEIHDYINDKIKPCTLEKCVKFERNNRNRETENILLDDKNKKSR